jgi:hypothetical protein
MLRKKNQQTHALFAHLGQTSLIGAYAFGVDLLPSVIIYSCIILKQQRA